METALATYSVLDPVKRGEELARQAREPPDGPQPSFSRDADREKEDSLLFSKWVPEWLLEALKQLP